MSNPCDVRVVRVIDGSAMAHARCRTCDATHIIDRRMFDEGRGPWRRVDGTPQTQNPCETH